MTWTAGASLQDLSSQTDVNWPLGAEEIRLKAGGDQQECEVNTSQWTESMRNSRLADRLKQNHRVKTGREPSERDQKHKPKT